MEESRKNKAAYMTGLDTMEFRRIPVPAPKEGEVLVKLEYVGICGSDVHYFHDGRCGDFVVNGDFILGHECAGSVVKTGAGVRELKVGDRVLHIRNICVLSSQNKSPLWKERLWSRFP